MNWGHKILLVYLLFVAGIVFLVIRSMNEKIDLVTPDYYAEELAHQKTINEISNVDKLNGKIEIQHQTDSIHIKFPKDFNGLKLKGTFKLYCPSDLNNDFTDSFTIYNNVLGLKIQSQKKGLYEIHLKWQSDTSIYYYQQRIIL